jgi:hypothetical protein
MVPEMLVIFNQLTWLTAGEDLGKLQILQKMSVAQSSVEW